MTSSGGFWPTALQEKLLLAALLDGDAARDAWAQWQALGGSVSAADGGSQRLLGHVYRNLSRAGFADPEVERLRGAYRHTWCRNQVRFHRLSGLLNTLQEDGIPTLVLKGAALAPLHYEDTGLRPMDDLDLLVPCADAARALRLLFRQGFGPPTASPEALVSIRHSVGTRNGEGEELDLHWHVLWECFSHEDDEVFWEASVPVRIGSVGTRSLCATDLLLHVCLHGAMWNPIPPIRWVVDAAMVLRRSTIDWDRLVSLARRFHQTLPARATLGYLERTLHLPIPRRVLAELESRPPSGLERLEFAMRQRPDRLLGGGARLLLGYGRWVRSRKSWPTPASLVTYLQRTWDLPHPASVPGAALTKLGRRLKRPGRSAAQAVPPDGTRHARPPAPPPR